MFSLSYNEIISKIKEEKGLSEEEVEEKIKEKLKQLSDLISKEGAAHIVANELGIKVVDVSKEVKINRLLTGMNNVVVVGKVLRMNDVINFNKNGIARKVVSFMFADDTGVIRAVLWDSNHIKFIEEGSINEDSIIKIKNGYVRANNGYKELHLGSKGELEINPIGVNLEFVDNIYTYDFVKKKIAELNEGDTNVGVFGTIVQVFEPRFYEACSYCGKKVEIIENDRKCKEHGIVKAEFAPVLNISFDDGTDSLRVVAFRNQVETLLGMSKEQIIELKNDINKFENIRQDLLGKQLIFVGRTTKNEMFGRKEMTIQRIVELEPSEILEQIQKE